MRITVETFGDSERRAIQQTRDADNAMGYEDAQAEWIAAGRPMDEWETDFLLGIADDLDRLTAEADDPYGDLGDLLDEVA